MQLIGTYVDGRGLTYEHVDGGFAVGGAPVTLKQVLAYDACGQIAWVDDEVRQWAHSLRAVPSVPLRGISAKRELVDQGPCFVYWRLSHRRRLVRDLIGFPIGLALVAIVYWGEPRSFAIWGGMYLVLALGFSAYNYWRWKSAAASGEAGQ